MIEVIPLTPHVGPEIAPAEIRFSTPRRVSGILRPQSEVISSVCPPP
jgi:hypothetical protein